jgi:hypothetical protein
LISDAINAAGKKEQSSFEQNSTRRNRQFTGDRTRLRTHPGNIDVHHKQTVSWIVDNPLPPSRKKIEAGNCDQPAISGFCHRKFSHLSRQTAEGIDEKKILPQS